MPESPDLAVRPAPVDKAAVLEWIRKPSSRIVRIPLGILLILGGVFSFLPLLEYNNGTSDLSN